jgi:hypothetical protein
VLAALALVLAASTLPAQEKDHKPTEPYQLGGLRSAFCIQLLLDPAVARKATPGGYRPLTAGQAGELHPAVRGVVKDQPEFAAWTPSRFCLFALDTLRGNDFSFVSKNGRKPLLFGVWTATAAATVGGGQRDVALLVLSNNGHLVHYAKNAGAQVRGAKLVLGKAAAGEEDTLMVPPADRFQVNVGKTAVTWDGRPPTDSSRTAGRVDLAWNAGARSGPAGGRLVIQPLWTLGMAGSFRVIGKDDFAKALKTSPIHFVGPQYRGGGGSLQVIGAASE